MSVEHVWKVCNVERNGIINMGKAIKEHCEDCSGGSVQEARNCVLTTCALWPFRKGKDPGKKRVLSEEQKKAVVDRFKKAREAQNP